MGLSDYLCSPAKELFICRVSKIGHGEDNACNYSYSPEEFHGNIASAEAILITYKPVKTLKGYNSTVMAIYWL